MHRVVLDTNIFVSSILVKTGFPAQAIQAWHDRQYVLLTSPILMSEIEHTLSYKRIRRKYNITDTDVADLLSLLQHDALVVPGHFTVEGAVPDDPDDDFVLACAVEGEANLIVSGDNHLLTLATYQGIPIVTVREFLQILSELGAE